jgi:hypothetical protein
LNSPKFKVRSLHVSTYAKQSENVEQKTLKHSLIAPELFRRVDIRTLIDFYKIEIRFSVEHEIEPIELEERVFEVVLLRLKEISMMEE